MRIDKNKLTNCKEVECLSCKRKFIIYEIDMHLNQEIICPFCRNKDFLDTSYKIYKTY